jgi:hypothetical protein
VRVCVSIVIDKSNLTFMGESKRLQYRGPKLIVSVVVASVLDDLLEVCHLLLLVEVGKLVEDLVSVLGL